MKDIGGGSKDYKLLKGYIDNDIAVTDYEINRDTAVTVKFLRPYDELSSPDISVEQYRQIFVDEVWERRDHEVAADTKLTFSSLIKKKAYKWNGPYGEYEDNVSGMLKNYRFKKGDHVCYNPDSSASLAQRVYECTHETDCVDYNPWDFRVGEYFLDRID